jgi:hypothetical protein
MDLASALKTLAADVVEALSKGVQALIETGDLDAGYAKALETLSDRRLAQKSFPDGKYIPPGV